MDKDQYIDLLFPIRGLDLSAGYGEQRPQTTPVGLNVRLYEPGTLRARGGQRAGLSKYVAGQLPSGAHVIQHLNYIVDPTGDATLGGGPAPAPGAAPLVPSGLVPIGGGGTGIQPPPKKTKLRTPVIDWFDPADISPNTPLDSAQLNASARDPNSGQGVAGSYVYTPSAGTVLSLGDHQSLSVSFTPSDATKYRSANKTVHINVVAGLYFQTQPSNVAPATAISPSVAVGAIGTNGNPIASFADNVTLSIASNPVGGTLSGTLTQTAVGGIATFADLQIDKSGTGYSLKASTANYRDATSVKFNVASAVTRVSNLGFAVDAVFVGDPFVLNYPYPVSVGDILIVFAYVAVSSGGNGNISGANDSLGSSYSNPATSIYTFADGEFLKLWLFWAKVTHAGRPIITLASTGSAVGCFEVINYSGLAASPLFTTVTANGVMGTPNSGVVAINQPGDLIVAAAGAELWNTTLGPTSADLPLTLLDSVAFATPYMGVADAVVSSGAGGIFHPGVTAPSGFGQWVALAASFKKA